MTRAAVAGVRRHFVTVGSRQLHYRRSGVGPPLVCLHHLPRSSEDLEPLMARWRSSFTVVAADQAGYGQSWPLAGTPSAAAYADDLLALLDALSLDRVQLFGDGIGALLALQFAQRYPERVVSLVCHATPLAPIEESALDAAFPAFEPRRDGSHLAWLWAHLREETIFDPWQPKRLAHRRLAAMPSAEALNQRLVQFLRSARHGRNYDVGIRALLRVDAQALVQGLRVPTLLLGASASREEALPESVAARKGHSTELVGHVAERREDGWPVIDDWLSRHRAGSPAPASPPVRAINGELWSDYVEVDGAQIHFHCNTDASTQPLLIQHDAASSVGTVEPITRSLIGRRTVFAFDLPGSGDSDDLLSGRSASVADYARLLGRAIAAAGLRQIDFYGMWGGGLVGLQLAHDRPELIRRLVMSNILYHEGDELRAVQAGYTPDVSPLWHGGHLLQVWHQMRDQGLFFPWFDKSEQGVLRREPYLDTNMVHERVCSLLKAGNLYRTAYQAHFVYPTLERLRHCPVPTMVATSQWDPNRPQTEVAAAAATNVSMRLLDPDFRRWGLSFIDFLEAS